MHRVFVTLATLVLLSPGISGRASDDPADPMQAKAVFKGNREFTKGSGTGQTVEVELRIIKRDGAKFTGVAIYRGKNSFDIKGTVKDGNIEWKEKRRTGEAFPTAVKGVVKDDKLTLSFRGSNPANGELVEGNMTLDLEEKK